MSTVTTPPPLAALIRCKACGASEPVSARMLLFEQEHERCCENYEDLPNNFEFCDARGEMIVCVGVDTEQAVFFNPGRVTMKIGRTALERQPLVDPSEIVLPSRR